MGDRRQYNPRKAGAALLALVMACLLWTDAALAAVAQQAPAVTSLYLSAERTLTGEATGLENSSLLTIERRPGPQVEYMISLLAGAQISSSHPKLESFAFNRPLRLAQITRDPQTHKFTQATPDLPWRQAVNRMVDEADLAKRGGVWTKMVTLAPGLAVETEFQAQQVKLPDGEMAWAFAYRSLGQANQTAELSQIRFRGMAVCDLGMTKAYFNHFQFAAEVARPGGQAALPFRHATTQVLLGRDLTPVLDYRLVPLLAQWAPKYGTAQDAALAQAFAQPQGYQFNAQAFGLARTALLKCAIEMEGSSNIAPLLAIAAVVLAANAVDGVVDLYTDYANDGSINGNGYSFMRPVYTASGMGWAGMWDEFAVWTGIQKEHATMEELRAQGEVVGDVLRLSLDISSLFVSPSYLAHANWGAMAGKADWAKKALYWAGRAAWTLDKYQKTIGALDTFWSAYGLIVDTVELYLDLNNLLTTGGSAGTEGGQPTLTESVINETYPRLPSAYGGAGGAAGTGGAGGGSGSPSGGTPGSTGAGNASGPGGSQGGAQPQAGGNTSPFPHDDTPWRDVDGRIKYRAPSQ